MGQTLRDMQTDVDGGPGGPLRGLGQQRIPTAVHLPPRNRHSWVLGGPHCQLGPGTAVLPAGLAGCGAHSICPAGVVLSRRLGTACADSCGARTTGEPEMLCALRGWEGWGGRGGRTRALLSEATALNRSYWISANTDRSFLPREAEGTGRPASKPPCPGQAQASDSQSGRREMAISVGDTAQEAGQTVSALILVWGTQPHTKNIILNAAVPRAVVVPPGQDVRAG